MRTVLADDQKQFEEIIRTYTAFHIQRDPQPEDDTPFPYEEKYKSYHTPTHRQWLREQRPLTIANRKRVAVMKELDNLVRSTDTDGPIDWSLIKKPDVFNILVSPRRIPVIPKSRTWQCPSLNCNSNYASLTQLQRHLFSQISHKSTITNPSVSRCFIQLPADADSARSIVEQIGTIPPPTRKCPFGTRSCRSNPLKKVPTCMLCQNMAQQIAEGPKAAYPKVNEYARSLRKRKPNK